MFSLTMIGILLAVPGWAGGHGDETVLKSFAHKSRVSQHRVVSLNFRAKEMRRAGQPSVEGLELTMSNGDELVLSLTESEDLRRMGVCGSHHVGTHDVMVTGCEGEDRSITIGGHGSWEYEASSSTFRRVDEDDVLNDCSSKMPPNEDEDAMAMKEAMNDMIAEGEFMQAEANTGSFDMEVRYYYDISLLERYDNDHERAKAAVRELNEHGKVLMRHESLGMPVNLVMRVEPVFVDLRTHAGPEGALDGFRAWLSPRNLCDDRSVAFHHLITNHRRGDTVAGVAYIGTVCHSRCFNTGITEIGFSVARSATVLAHEMGHNLGAQHTFHPSNDGRNCRGIMSYGVAPDTWSVCSRDSWQADYNLFVRSSGQSRADTCFVPSNGAPNLGGAAPTFPPVPRPAPRPTRRPAPTPTRRPAPTPTSNPNGGGGCRTFVGVDVESGFRPHAQSGATGVTSDDACRALCNAARGCTIWVRQPSTNTCWLSTQTGSIRLVSRPDRNAGLRCFGTVPAPRPTSRPTPTPTPSPTSSPTFSPTPSPTFSPTFIVTAHPTSTPTDAPTSNPTASPSESPSSDPTSEPIVTVITLEPTADPTSDPTANPTLSPTSSPTSHPTSTPTDATNGAGCEKFVNRDVASGFRHHAQSGARGVTSDDACRELCNAARGCTIWVRQPSTNTCWLSTQTGSIRLRTRADRNTGLRCVGTTPAPGPSQSECRCSGRTSRSGGDCSRGWCYTNPGACSDGRRSNALRDQEFSFLACQANPSNPTPNPTPAPTPMPTQALTPSESECANVRWTRNGRCGRRFGGQVCSGGRWLYCSRFGWCGNTRQHNVGNVAYDHPKGCVGAY